MLLGQNISLIHLYHYYLILQCSTKLIFIAKNTLLSKRELGLCFITEGI